MQHKIRAALAAAAVAAISLGLAVAASGPASAAPTCASLATPAADHSYVSPIHSGQALDAINWGGSGHAATACTGAVVNNPVKSYQYSIAGVAADFTPVKVTQGSTGSAVPVPTNCVTDGCVQLVYTPGNQVNVSQPLCLSTVLNQQGAYSRLRPCAGLDVSVNGSGVASIANASAASPATGTVTNGNEWQDFAFLAAGDGFNQIAAVASTSGFAGAENIAGFGGNGTQVITWPQLNACSGKGCSENQIWETLPAA